LGDGWIWLVFMLACTWASDTVAYLVGRKWGKHRIAPTLSPGKTVEGAVGGVLGSFLAASHDYFNWLICGLALLTTIGFQIISNFANDYGDGVKGTDNLDRIGPKRAIQSGEISPEQLLKTIKITSAITFMIASLLIYTAFGKDDFVNLLILTK